MKNTAGMIRTFIERDARRYDEMSDAIWAFAEYRFQEYRSCELQKEHLRAEGFRITERLAEWGDAELFLRPELIEQAKEDLIRARGGEEYRCLLPEDVTPEGL
ncbi:MAG: hypothetical protein IKH56_06840 [Oscillospiraceae bacterium]|nr:hypothetical protein [Oscillospiraceae bacterium]